MGRKIKSNYMKISREILDCNNRLSRKAIILYLWLNELEQRFTEQNGDRDWFMYTNDELVELTGMSIKVVKEAKRELIDRGFISVSRGNWCYSSTGKSSIKQPSVYRILK